MVIKKCKICGKEFEAEGCSFFCSYECRKIARKEFHKKYYDEFNQWLEFVENL